MGEIKQYKPISLVFYINGNWDRDALPLDEEKREAFKKAVENNKMVELEWITINTFDIKEIRPANSITELEKFFYSQSWQDRSFLNQRTLKMAGQKVNTIEYWLWLWEEQAIERLTRMLSVHHENLSDNSEK